MDERWLGWHFLPENGHTRWGKHRKPAPGVTAVAKGKLILCKNGLHASKRAMDALAYAPGTICCWVELSGEIVERGDKACARRRTVIAMADASKELYLFACWCAETAMKAANVTDAACWNAPKTRRKWLLGKATDDELAAAYSAAYSAADSAAYSAADSAAWSAAYNAADSAADSAAWSAAYNAARSAAHSVAYSAAWSAADSAAYSAARSGAYSAQNKELTKRLRRALGITATRKGRAGHSQKGKQL